MGVLLEIPRKVLADRPPSPATAVDSFTESVRRAFARLALNESEIADLQHVSPATWSKQKAGSEGHGMRVQRIDLLPPAYLAVFELALAEELARKHGWTVVRPGGHMAALANALRGISDALGQMAATWQPALPFDRAVNS